MNENDIKMMKIVLRLAKKGAGSVSPNPMVGAVLTKNGKIISTGYHKRAGEEHAEINALKKVGFDAKDCTLYVNLEPCCHSLKKTPPCISAITRSKVKRVIVAMLDPNPMVNGKGIEYLRNHGIEVDVGCLQKEAEELNRAFKKSFLEKIPYVILKIAMTIDGKIADRYGNSKWITSESARKNVHKTRNLVDAVLAGIGTVMKDDPLLLPYLVRQKKSLQRIILDTSLKISEKSKILDSVDKGEVLIATCAEKEKNEKASILKNKGIKIQYFNKTSSGIDLNELLFYLGEKNIMTLLVEGGKRVWSSFIKERAFDEIHLYIGGKILSDQMAISILDNIEVRKIEDALLLKLKKIRRFSNDIFIQFFKE